MPSIERLQSYSTDRFLAYEKQVVETMKRAEESRRRAQEEARAKKRRSKKKKKKK